MARQKFDSIARVSHRLSVKVYIDGNREFPPESEIDPDMVSIDPDGGIIRLHDMIFPAGIGNVRVIAKLAMIGAQDLELAVLEAISSKQAATGIRYNRHAASQC
jgi:hypothetical protein